jgi:hypothetical protein
MSAARKPATVIRPEYSCVASKAFGMVPRAHGRDVGAVVIAERVSVQCVRGGAVSGDAAPLVRVVGLEHAGSDVPAAPFSRRLLLMRVRRCEA